VNKGNLIIINGAVNSEKTNTCRAMQDILDEPYVLLGLDYFSKITPSKQAKPLPKELQQSDSDYINISTAPLFNDVIYTSFKAISAYLDEGNNVISDQLFGVQEWFQDALHIFHPYHVFFVGLHFPAAEHTKRAQPSSDHDIIVPEFIGNSNASALNHSKMVYDFEINSTNLSVQEIAQQIISAYKKTPNPTAFKTLADKLL